MDPGAATVSGGEFVRRAAEAMSTTTSSIRSFNPTALVTPLASFEEVCAVAAPVYASLRESDAQTVITVSPSTEGSFRRITIARGDVYRTSTCEMPLDDIIRNELCDEDDDIFADDQGHPSSPAASHLPFFKSLFPDGTLVPIVMGEETPEFCRELATALAEVMFNKRVVLVATVGEPEGEPDALETFYQALDQGDYERLRRLQVNGDVKLPGFGGLLVVLQASAERRASAVEVVSERRNPLCALISRAS